MKPQGSCSFFTLLELLVVIAVIVLLLSMLLPSLKQAKESARRIKCLSNIKQYGLVLLSYSQDNNGFFPLPVYSSNYPATLKDMVLQLEDYTKPDIFFCPSVLEKKVWEWPYITDYTQYHGRNFPNSPRRVSDPPGYLLLIDYSTCSSTGNPTKNHSDSRGMLAGANAMRLDGSAAWHKRNELTLIVVKLGVTFFFVPAQ